MHLASQATDAACSARVPVRVAMRYGSPSIADVLSSRARPATSPGNADVSTVLRLNYGFRVRRHCGGTQAVATGTSLANGVRVPRLWPVYRCARRFRARSLANAIQPDGLLLSFRLPQRASLLAIRTSAIAIPGAITAAKLDFPLSAYVSFQSRVGRSGYSRTRTRLSSAWRARASVICVLYRGSRRTVWRR